LINPVRWRANCRRTLSSVRRRRASIEGWCTSGNPPGRNSSAKVSASTRSDFFLDSAISRTRFAFTTTTFTLKFFSNWQIHGVIPHPSTAAFSPRRAHRSNPAANPSMLVTTVELLTFRPFRSTIEIVLDR
jgi:hypothetical protein